MFAQAQVMVKTKMQINLIENRILEKWEEISHTDNLDGPDEMHIPLKVNQI